MSKVFAVPHLSEADSALLAEIDGLRNRLGREVGRPRPWIGTLRRQTRAATARSSTAIEGFHVDQRDAEYLVDGGAAANDDQEALAGYALAMSHVGVLADDPSFRWSDRVVLDLHFEACHRASGARPGRWRDGPVHVTAPGGGIAYSGPPADQVPGLIDAALATFDGPAHPVVRAAMAHLQLVSIHPFRDGNGRISRIIQSLVLARDGVLAPELGSIEEHLAANTAAYYAVLQEVQGGSWLPGRNAAPWVRFCLHGHLAQAQARLAQVAAAAARWAKLEDIADARSWPDRLVIAMERSLLGGIDRAEYAREAGVSLATASNDLRRLIDAGLVERRGATQNAEYVASAALQAAIRG